VVEKARHLIRVGDIIVVPHGTHFRTIRVKGLGSRRGPSMEAQSLYEVATVPVRVSELETPWKRLLMED